MSGRRRRRRISRRRLKLYFAIVAIAAVILLGVFGAHFVESRLKVDVDNAGKQMTAHKDDGSTAQVFMNDSWYQKKDVETLLVMGVDNFGSVTGSDSYNNENQADFLVLFVKDNQTGESTAIHINRDTMTDITMLGVTGEAVGTQYAQLALAYNYGRGQNDSSRNTAEAVERLLYGIEVDKYITVTMDAVPIMNDWAGGVSVEVLDDMTDVDAALAAGQNVRLSGEQALTYVRTRMGLEDSTNVNRMKRQRQYASAWVQTAQEKLKDSDAVAQLIMDMSDHHFSDCNAETLAEFASGLGENPTVEIYEIPGESIKGEEYIEFYADENALQQLVLDMFYEILD